MTLRPLALSSLALLALPLAGCPRPQKDAAPDAQATPVASASASSAPGSPCTMQAPIVVDRGARLETGLTAVPMGDAVAIGYATGDGPRVTMVDGSGVHAANTDWSHVRDVEARPGTGIVRHLLRVTPLGVRGGKMRVGIDLRDVQGTGAAAKTSHLRCGAGDDSPIVIDDDYLNFQDPSEDDVASYPVKDTAVDYQECRTFGDADEVWAVATRVRRASKDNHDLLYEWMVDQARGQATVHDPVIDHREVKPAAGKYPKVEHFFAPVGVRVSGAGVVLVARDQGSLVVARRTSLLERASAPTTMWLGAAAGMPALAERGGTVLLATTEWQKSDLYASSFPATGAPRKPEKVALGDTGGDPRDSASLDAASDGSILVAFVDGKAPARRLRMVVLGGDLKPKIAQPIDVTPPDVNVGEARIVSLGGGKAMLAYIDATGALSSVTASCKY
jgi:hypothetical protein